MKTYVTVLYDRLDKICEREYGDTDRRIVEYVLEMNPGLERHGILLPLGTKIMLPPRPPERSGPADASTILLWA